MIGNENVHISELSWLFEKPTKYVYQLQVATGDSGTDATTY